VAEVIIEIAGDRSGTTPIIHEGLEDLAGPNARPEEVIPVGTHLRLLKTRCKVAAIGTACRMSEEVDLSNTQTLVDRLAAGRVIDARYRLDRLLGRGGMGVVWLAQDETLNRPVALKFLAELLAHDHSAIEDLKHETSRCLELTHPRIVRIYDFVQDAGLAAISMEFVEGQTLSERRAGKPNRCFDADDLRAWVEQLADALSYAHRESRVVHRDLKPSNLMIDRGSMLKVSDFGISRSMSDSLTRVSGAERISGTMAYMSPQQGQGHPPAASDDIYAVGATLFELLTGKPPFYGPAALVFQQLLHVEAPRVNDRRRELTNAQCGPVPAAWEATIAACLAKDPAGRPKDVREIAERLRVETATHIAVTEAWPAAVPPVAQVAPITHIVPTTHIEPITPLTHVVPTHVAPITHVVPTTHGATVASARVIRSEPDRPWLWPALLTGGLLAAGGLGWVAWNERGAIAANTGSQRAPIAHTPAPSSPSPAAQAFKVAPTPTPVPVTPDLPAATTAVESPTAKIPSLPTPEPVVVSTEAPPARESEAPAATPKPTTPKPTASRTTVVPKGTSTASTKPKSRSVKPVQRAEVDPEPRPRRKPPEPSTPRPAVAMATPKPAPRESSVSEEQRKRAATARLMIERTRPP
jgi:serine/threonine protein kinase